MARNRFSPDVAYALERQDLDALSQAIATDPSQHAASDATGATLLHYAIINKRIDWAELLCSAGADANSQDIAGQTPLHYAAAEGDFESASWLLSHRGDPNVLDNSGRSPLRHASFSFARSGIGNDVIQLLLRHGAKMDLMDAIYTDNATIASGILQQDPAALDRSPNQLEILEAAIDYRRDAILNILVSNCSCVSSHSVLNGLLIHACKFSGSTLYSVERLLKSGADPQCIDIATGLTAVRLADERGRKDLVSLMQTKSS